jgi:hypothetical protein
VSDFPPVKTIAIDFDGVIHSYEDGWQGGNVYGSPKEGCIKVINELKHRGFKVVVLTARDELEPVKNWLAAHKIDIEVTNTKPPAIAYIDDRAIRFTNWEDIRNYFI